MDIKKAIAIDEKQCITRSQLFKDEKGFEPCSSTNIPSKSFTPRNNKISKLDKHLAEVFRTDFITAMKVPDSQILPAEDCLTLKDTWRQEWEKGVQVPVNPDKIPKLVVRNSGIKSFLNVENHFKMPQQLFNFNEDQYNKETIESTATCNYDLDDIDMEWLKSVSNVRTLKKANTIDALTMERALTWFERECFTKMAHAVATKEGLSIEYDESTTCNVCLSPDAEDGNEIIFCDACNMCVHQHCYGVLEIPEGNWLCNPCSRGVLSPPCCLCPNKGGAMKRMKDSYEWVHVICAWWIPEVKIEDVKFIERIRKDKIPASRWNLLCSICREKGGASIQCSVKRCVKAYHVTCSVKDGLEMKTVILPEKDDVQHISFCSKHCTPVPPDQNPHRNSKSGDEIENNRLKEIRKLECEFYNLVSVSKAARELNLQKEVTRRLLSFWTMKRRDNDNAPLIPLTLEQHEKLSGKQGVVLLNQQKTLEMERFLHLRQDLERLRNLCYMIVRREKVRKELHRTSMEIFYKQNDMLVDSDGNITGCQPQSLQHPLTLFNNFSETYTTEQVYKKEHGITTSIYDTTLEEDEFLNTSQFEVLNEKDFERDERKKFCYVTSSSNRTEPLAGGTQRNIFDFFRKQELSNGIDLTDLGKSEENMEDKHEVTETEKSNVSTVNKKLDFEKPKKPDNTIDSQPVSPLDSKIESVNEPLPNSNRKEIKIENGETNFFDKIDKAVGDESNGQTQPKTSSHKTPLPIQVNKTCQKLENENKELNDDSVFKTSALAKRGKKRFCNLNFLDDKHQRRNSPRLNKMVDKEDDSCEKESENCEKVNTPMTRMKFITTNHHHKKRRLNSCGDFITENGDDDEIRPDCIRITRSRVSSCH